VTAHPIQKRFAARWNALWLTAALLSACAGSQAVDLSPAWPERAADYDDAYRAWTRHGTIRSGYEQVLDLHATFKSPAWRAAHVDYLATKQNLSPEARQRLQAEQIKVAEQEPYELQLLVTTNDFRQNDLHRGERSIWRLALVDDRGNQVEPIEVKRDRRPIDVIRAEYPDMGDFATAYIVRFPRTVEVLRPDASKFSLEMASVRGGVDLVWNDR
jgi:hypothetical protein